ncbi:dolichol-phosphate mannosyltransferase [Hymenobacter daecheongensis DSM 21074]|uniref:Dolichol-phosphate mannosyltransferase n=1 Tax=Hymenobacter daecheongensis DSM 21074 TaxID=1121955 RepID=A0A1M6GVK1_9BACT|nr:glycosyltransferase family 2 protein [Hymenobacter daecheongensis]SHJ13959.1 dolichol-phosphate mannosyltransferase [Hymenobacter daecheongensis DSM 21074]
MCSSPTNSLPHISVVIPVYGCVGTLTTLHQRLTTALANLTSNYQLILVNDNSPDGSWTVIESLAATDSQVLGLNLSRNFGQHAAITAGLDRAVGEWVVVMDCDLQDVPEEIPNLYAYAQSHELDIVFGRRVNRQDTATKQLTGRVFHRALAWLGGPQHDPTTGNFGIFHHRVVVALQLLREPIRAFPLQVRWLGFRQGSLNVQHAARERGQSSYSFGQLLRLAFMVILSYSDKPLRLLVKLGGVIVVGALLGTTGLLYGQVFGTSNSTLWLMKFTLLSIWLLGGLLLGAMGLVGLYVSRTFDGVKNRPLYIIREETGANTSK